jgi:hypothetical protein
MAHQSNINFDFTGGYFHGEGKLRPVLGNRLTGLRGSVGTVQVAQ